MPEPEAASSIVDNFSGLEISSGKLIDTSEELEDLICGAGWVKLRVCSKVFTQKEISIMI